MTKQTKATVRHIRRKRLRTDVAEWFAGLDRLRGDSLFQGGRNQSILRGKIGAEKKRFFRLADQLAATSEPAKRKRIKENLARLAFGQK